MSFQARRNLHSRPAWAVSRRGLLRGMGGVAGSLMAAALPSEQAIADPSVLHVLAWGGNVGEDVVGPFTQQTGIRIVEKPYAVDEEMIALLEGSPAGSYDLVGADAEYQFMLHEGGFIQPLDSGDYPLEDYWPYFQRVPQHWKDGKLYTVSTSFGFNGLVYNTKRLSAADVESYEICWDPKLKGKVTLNDWYLNSMSAMSLSLQHYPQNDLNAEQFQKLKERLFSLGPQISSIGVWASIFSQLASEEAWIIPGIGDWVSLSLRADGLPMEAAIPKEGATLWIEGYSIVKGTQKGESAKKFLQYLASPEGQMRMQIKSSYFGASPSVAGWKKLSQDRPDMADLLKHRLDKPNLMTQWEARKEHIFQRDLPKQQSISEWVDVWNEFKNSL